MVLLEQLNIFGCIGCPSVSKTFSPGTYNIKFSSPYNSINGLRVVFDTNKASINIINWGKNPTSRCFFLICGVNKIYSPEPDFFYVTYQSAVFNRIPSNLFSKKKDNIEGSHFVDCNNITEIPEDLFKNWENIKYMGTFRYCKNIKNVSENLFKYNTLVTNFDSIFSNTDLVSIPENLFKYNAEATNFHNVFSSTKITSIPGNLFKYNKKAKNLIHTFVNTKITSIPGNLFDNNPNITHVISIFANNFELKYIPQNIINKFLSIPNNNYAFKNCSSASNYDGLNPVLK